MEKFIKAVSLGFSHNTRLGLVRYGDKPQTLVDVNKNVTSKVKSSLNISIMTTEF